jgi:hypothetical protein
MLKQYRFFLAMEIIRSKILLAMLSTVVDALILMSPVFINLKSEFISESNFPFDNLIQ